MAKFSDGPWDGSKSKYTVEQLLKAIPASMARYARRVAKAANREVTKGDCHLPYKTPEQIINLNGITAALGRIDQVKGPSSTEKTATRAELERQRNAARRALGKDDEKMSRLLELAAQAISIGVTTSIFSENTEEILEPTISDIVLDNPDNLHYLMGLLEVPSNTQLSAGIAMAPIVATPIDEGEENNVEPKQVDSNDFRPLPNFETLGITRPSGPCTDDEMEAFKGQTKNDGSPVTKEDFLSVGCLLANNDLIEDRMRVIPALELSRLATILSTRSKQSDTDHSREVLTGHFTVINPSIGIDPSIPLNSKNPLRNAEPYTALVARAVFPLADEDEGQKAAVEAVRRGRLKNLSITPQFGAVVCSHCSEMPVYDVMSQDGLVTNLIMHPNHAQGLVVIDKPIVAVIRTPNDMCMGGYSYNDVNIMSTQDNGVVSIEPTKLYIGPDSKMMIKLNNMPMMFAMGGSTPKYCSMHGLEGQISNGSQVVGVFCQVTSLINVAATDAGAINDSRIVLDASVRY